MSHHKEERERRGEKELERERERERERTIVFTILSWPYHLRFWNLITLSFNYDFCSLYLISLFTSPPLLSTLLFSQMDFIDR